jgi:hypothetical protein
MDPITQNALCNAEDVVRDLVQLCRKGAPLYNKRPRAVAQVSRNAKWLLNALDVLRRKLEGPADSEEQAG